MRLIVLIIVVSICVLKSFAQVRIQKVFEFEDALTADQDEMWVWRSEASNLKNLRLVDENGLSAVELTLCVEPLDNKRNVSIYIEDIRYSNDGPSDAVKLRFEGVNIGSFRTFEKWRSGHEWNVFRNSGGIGPLIMLSKGKFTLVIIVKTDRWGVELDRIKLNAVNQHPKQDIICGASVYTS